MSKLRGFSPLVRKQIKERAGVDGDCVRCEDCGYFAAEVQFHHRIPRGRGGTRRPEVNNAANGLSLCRPCHEYVESYREEAINNGQLISQHRKILPALVPVRLHDGWFLLDDEGSRWMVPTPNREAS